ncbi:aminotransferase class IV [Mucisphaera calidilacus]|uniref:D-alanine aminotransferase n=1 Tax=Mucisphaera calidilacus TaxID=2527982 RepID=A0A518C027_9BACT|nr:aminotransferase class IV [Mucisphaera calidilacus]QDU72577.1 D-alanine aminotransferase [Mucisphaera calidilacus]
MVQQPTPAADPVVYYNGEFIPSSHANVSVEERGTLFGEGVYEVTRVYNAHPFALDEHLERLLNSLRGIGLKDPQTLAAARELKPASAQLLEIHNLAEALVYWQITRGPAQPRSFLYQPNTRPSVLAIAYPTQPINTAGPPPTTTATLLPDDRWANCWIKSTMLLPNNLAYNQAREAGFGAALLQRHGLITEASNANAMFVRDGKILTHPDDGKILNGITRQIVLNHARNLNIPVAEQPLPIAELNTVDEAFLTGTTTHVTPVLAIDDQPVADAKPGPVALQLHHTLMNDINTRCRITTHATTP